MRRIRLGPTPLAVECLNAHQAHQPANVPAANAVAAEPKHVAQHPSASKGIIRMKPVDQAHQRKVGLRDRHRHVVQGASMRAPAAALDARAAKRGRDRSSLCARPVDTPERAF
jgi:hypothetical protein